MAASRVRALKGWHIERNGKRQHVHQGDLLHANSPLLAGHEDDVEPADFITTSEEVAEPEPARPVDEARTTETEGES